MIAWLFLLIAAAAVLAALWRFARLDRAGLQFVASALLLALAGYAWQGSPGLAGSLRSAAELEQRPESFFAQSRRDLFGRFDAADSWLTIAEHYQRKGNSRDAAGALRSALRKRPDNFVLWLGLADALVQHSDGMMTPAAQLAFQRADELAPNHPGPIFFYGLAMAQGGRLDEAESVWRNYLATRPVDGRWRSLFEEQLRQVGEARAMGQVAR